MTTREPSTLEEAEVEQICVVVVAAEVAEDVVEGDQVLAEVAVEDAVAVVVTVVKNMEVASTDMSKIIKYETALISANVHLRTNGVRVRLLSVISKVKVVEIAEMARDSWYLDSGTSSHITNQIKDYVEFTPLNAGIRVGGNHYLRVEGIGTVKKELRTTHGRRTITLRGVRYSPELQCSLYSVRRQLNHSAPLCERVKVHFDVSEYAGVVLQSGTAKAHVDETKLYCLELESPRESVMVALSALPTQVSNFDLWHMRLGHPGKNAFNALSSFDQ
ncbi:unnamed protein product [Phytophthora fragariaefolia]|uniref:Unnamed protein product n=1 Tax=Phytophthora fragariaefolia TaxID=1490495 RepID=A0A9W6U835_9STRA|nr:unnamed protein product [Phytophthora fragariaefolia]